jgi:hypothetical protein
MIKKNWLILLLAGAAVLMFTPLKDKLLKMFKS